MAGWKTTAQEVAGPFLLAATCTGRHLTDGQRAAVAVAAKEVERRELAPIVAAGAHTHAMVDRVPPRGGDVPLFPR